MFRYYGNVLFILFLTISAEPISTIINPVKNNRYVIINNIITEKFKGSFILPDFSNCSRNIISILFTSLLLTANKIKNIYSINISKNTYMAKKHAFVFSTNNSFISVFYLFGYSKNYVVLPINGKIFRFKLFTRKVHR
jgi:hypothetical protein